MRIIDLLNKIANGEEVPHFEYDDIECYLGADGYLKDQYGDNVEWWIDKKWLNKKVKILEEENKIEKLENGKWHIEGKGGKLIMLKDKIDELIDEINSIKENK